MTTQHSTLAPIQCGAMHLSAPSSAPEVVSGTHGYLWQWTGDTQPLITLVLSVRADTRMTSELAQRAHLRWELDRLAAAMDASGPPAASDGPGRPVGTVDGRRMGLEVHNRVLVATVGSDMYILHVLTRDTEEGRELAQQVTDSVRL